MNETHASTWPGPGRRLQWKSQGALERLGLQGTKSRVSPLVGGREAQKNSTRLSERPERLMSAAHGSGLLSANVTLHEMHTCLRITSSWQTSLAMSYTLVDNSAYVAEMQERCNIRVHVSCMLKTMLHRGSALHHAFNTFFHTPTPKRENMDQLEDRTGTSSAFSF
jgi:sirohydrochlorin ferrochelatase